MTLSVDLVMSSDDVMIMSMCDGGAGAGDDTDASPCKFEMECSSHYHQFVFDWLLHNFSRWYMLQYRRISKLLKRVNES